ncbi:MAG: hypothetical protein WC444_04785 [Candidatus Paceibacterota bacterium]
MTSALKGVEWFAEENARLNARIAILEARIEMIELERDNAWAEVAELESKNAVLVEQAMHIKCPWHEKFIAAEEKAERWKRAAALLAPRNQQDASETVEDTVAWAYSEAAPKEPGAVCPECGGSGKVRTRG